MSGVRDIPGFYYDTEKKKYFRIQPNHIAPAGAKHSVENVRNERREAKRRKYSGRRMARLLQDTVHRAPILNDPLSRSSLLREYGYAGPHDIHYAQSHTIAQNLDRDCTVDLGGCGECGRRNLCYDFAPFYDGDMIACSAGDSSAMITLWDISTDTIDYTGPQCDVRLANLPSTGTSLSTSSSGLLIATASISHGPNVILCTLPAPEHPPIDLMPRIYLTLGQSSTELTSSAANPFGLTSAVVSSTADAAGAAFALDCNRGRVTSELRAPALRSADWLSSSTAVLGARSGAVLLWDHRAAGSVGRFRHPGEARQVLASDGQGVWVAGVGGVAKYDTRMGRDAVVRVRERGLAAQASIAVWKEAGMVAVATESKGILLVEERTGDKVGFAAEEQVKEDGMEGGIPGVCRIGRMRAGTDADGRMALLYSIGERVHKYVF